MFAQEAVELMNSIYPTLPAGSRVKIKSNNGDPVIVIPSDGGLMRYWFSAFLLCWLGIWIFGFRSALTQLLSGTASAPIFLFFVLWTLGGAFAVIHLYRLVRPPVPETLTLKFDRVIYDPGIPPFRPSYYPTASEFWKDMFPKRTIVELDTHQLATLRLRETGAGNRLTVDANASRLDLAKTCGEIDREWLYQVLASRYSLPISGAASVDRRFR
jgi:hypothetical protein